MNARTETTAAEACAVEISRIFDAPRSLVFKAWTTPEHLVRWWGPNGFSATAQAFEFREGGHYHLTMHSPGMTPGMSGTFREIVEPSRIVFTFAWDDEDGQPGRETLITVTLAAEGDRTRLTFRHAPFNDIETRDDHAKGWGEVIEKLALYVAEL